MTSNGNSGSFKVPEHEITGEKWFVRHGARIVFAVLVVSVFVVATFSLIGWNWLTEADESPSTTLRDLMLLAAVPATIFLAIWRNSVANSQADTASSQANTADISTRDERYQQAVQLLNSESHPVRLGAIVSLRKLATAFPASYMPEVFAMMCAYIRASSAPMGEAGRGGNRDEADISDGDTVDKNADIRQAREEPGRIGSGDTFEQPQLARRLSYKYDDSSRLKEIRQYIVEPYPYDLEEAVRFVAHAAEHFTDIVLRGRSKIHLDHANLKNMDLAEIKLDGVNLSGTDLSYAIMIKADLVGAELVASEMYRTQLVDANMADADLGHAWLMEAALTGAILTRTGLHGSLLIKANLSGADLTDADLSGADLTDADLTGADLTDADLAGAKLIRADLTGADLTGADLTGADLTGTIGLD